METRMPPTRQETLWVLRAQSGDREAMNQLFLAVQDPLYGFLRSLGADTHRAEDLLQEVLVTIHRKIRWLRDPALFRPWTFRIAHRLAARHLASARREQDRFEVDADVEAVSDVVEGAAPPAGDLTELLEHVSPMSRPVLALRFQHGLELAEIADVLEIPLGTVKSRLGYGLATLRKKLEPGRAP
jgi:RNA polymerase sigma-70 factor (ECF subfamily)